MDRYYSSIIYIFLAAILFLTLPAIFISLGLPPEGDAVAYRIPIIQWILRHRAYPNWSWAVVDDFPLLGELLMLPLYIIWPGLARLVPIAAYFGSAYFGVKIIGLFQNKNEVKAANNNFFFLSGMVWILGLRPLAIQSNLFMVDNIASCFAVGSLYFLLKGRVIYSAIFLGACMATRYTMWGLAPILFFCLLYLQISEKKINFKILISYFAIPFIFILPFMIRNYIVNDGNPIFPFFAPGYSSNTSYSVYGRGKDFISLLILPFDLLYTNSFVKSFYDYTLGKLFYIQLLAVSFVIFINSRVFFQVLIQKMENPKMKIVLFFVFLQTVVWFYGTQQLRMLVPSLILVNALMFLLVFRFSKKIYIFAVASLTLFSIISIQKDSLLMATGEKESIFEEAKNKAIRCLSKIPKTELIASYSDDYIGFLDRDFILFTAHYMHYSKSKLPDYNYVYYGYEIKPRDGFELWPKEQPCMLKRI